MSGGEVAGLVVAVFWAVLVAFLAVVLVRLAEALREATRLVAGVREQTVPLLGEAAGAVRAAGARLERADTVTPAVTSVVKADDAATAATGAREVREARVVAAGASALSSTVSSAFDGPLAKVAALGYGLRYAVHQQGDGDRAARRAPGRGRSSARTARTARAIRAARAVRARTAIAAPRAELGRGGGRSTRRSKG